MRVICLLVLVLIGSTSYAVEPDPKSVEFFEKRIRPTLVEHCYKCHSQDAQKANKLKGGLLLDSKDGWAVGGDSGPAIVPGKPAASLLLQTLKYEGDVQMPPAGQLPEGVIKDFESWIASGAADPRASGGGKKQAGLSIEEGKKFWSYRPISKPEVPAANPWARTDIDRFIFAALQARQLSPMPAADRATLARRLYFDLLGLPPTPAQIDEFVQDQEANAVEKLVDRLLARPEFGERWGRHWLDLARYAESVTLRGFIFKEAWRYRDYVIDSFQRDVPYDRFLKEQLAGDLLPSQSAAERSRHLVATTYLMLGNTNLEEQDKKQLRMDFVDEQLDVISKGLLAQTLTCARCHDHKFDPISTRDYYAMAGILRNVKAMEHSNVSKWLEIPLPMEAAAEVELKKHEARIAEVQAKLTALKAKTPDKPAVGVLAVKDIRGIVVDDTQAKKVGTWQDSTSNKTYIGDAYTHDQNGGKGEKTITFQPELAKSGRYEVRFAYSPGGNRADQVPVTVFSADGEKTIDVNMQKTPPIQGRYISLGTFKFEKNGQSFVIVSNEGTKGHVTADAVVFLAEAGEQDVGTPPAQEADNAALLEAELKKLQAAAPKRPMAMAPVEENEIEDCRVHIRGLVGNLGDTVPRGVLSVTAAGAPAKFPRHQSGRLELANWIASPDNPLTARVYVNRVWHWLFGSGLVRTVDNFGTTGEKPSHPELLDHLAARFIADGWSVKKLIRSIVLSATYQQSVVTDPGATIVKADPENTLFGRANRRRLEAEAIRDAILVVSGKLSPTRGGPSFSASLSSDYNYKHSSLQRSIYLPHFRNSMPELLEVFDMADPSLVTGKRSTSTVAPQALFLMNNAFVVEQSRHAAARLLAEKHLDADTRITQAYRWTLGRTPTAGERAAITRSLAAGPSEADAWSSVFHALLASADFRFLK